MNAPAAVHEIAEKLEAAGFADVELEPWRVYRLEDARTFLSGAGVDVDVLSPALDGAVESAFVRARKPDAGACCGPACCH